jgi:hypothetical protein
VILTVEYCNDGGRVDEKRPLISLFSFSLSLSQEFYQKNMAKVQEKMKDCLEKQTISMDSLERLSNALHTSTAADEVAMQDEAATTVPLAVANLSEELLAAKELKGENKAPIKGTIHKKSKRKSKHGVTAAEKKEPKEKRRPRYFVQF